MAGRLNAGAGTRSDLERLSAFGANLRLRNQLKPGRKHVAMYDACRLPGRFHASNGVIATPLANWPMLAGSCKLRTSSGLWKANHRKERLIVIVGPEKSWNGFPGPTILFEASCRSNFWPLVPISSAACPRWRPGYWLKSVRGMLVFAFTAPSCAPTSMAFFGEPRCSGGATLG